MPICELGARHRSRLFVMDYVRYLQAKRSVDDRAINPDVLHTFIRSLRDRPASKNELRVLEVGAGIGAMLERLLRKGAFQQYVPIQ